MASGHAMVFYSAAWGIGYAAHTPENLGIEWRCQNGHEMPPTAKFCAECDAPAVPVSSHGGLAPRALEAGRRVARTLSALR